MARPPSEEGDIKVRPETFEKAVFIEASRAARQTLGQWMIAAAVEHARRQGFEIRPPKRGPLAAAEPVPKKKGGRT